MRYRYKHRDRIYEVNIEGRQGGYRATIDGQPYDLEVLDEGPGTISLLFAGRPMTLYWADDGERKWVSRQGCTYLLEKPSPRPARRLSDHAAEGTVRAPMPAQVRAVEVREGETITKGQTLLLLEAMKMEIRLQAPRDGRVVALKIQTGDSVDRDQALLELE